MSVIAVKSINSSHKRNREAFFTHRLQINKIIAIEYMNQRGWAYNVCPVNMTDSKYNTALS